MGWPPLYRKVRRLRNHILNLVMTDVWPRLTQTRTACIFCTGEPDVQNEQNVNVRCPLPAGKVRQDFAETVNRVAYGGERIVLHREAEISPP